MLLIRGAKVLTVSNGTLDPGDILIDKGKIVEVSPHIPAPDGAQIVGAAGKWAMPGLIDCHTHLGLDETYAWDGVNELNEIGDPVTPALRCADGLNTDDPAFHEALSRGITAVISHTGSIQLLSGQSAAFKLVPGGPAEKALINPCVGLKGGFGGTPKRFYHAAKGFPVTRMGQAAVLRQAFADAAACRGGWRPPEGGAWNREESLKALLPLFDGTAAWRVHVYKLYDILTCLRIAEEFHIRVVLEHGGEAPMIAEELKRRNICVTVGPSGFIGARKPETFYPVMNHVRELAEAGVIFSFQSDHPIIHTASLPLAVAGIVRDGYIDEDTALRAMTLNAAVIMDAAGRMGSIEAGKDADIVIADGPIFGHGTAVERVFIDGTEVFSAKK